MGRRWWTRVRDAITGRFVRKSARKRRRNVHPKRLRSAWNETRSKGMDEALFRFQHEWKAGSRDTAREIAREYIAVHQELAERLEVDYVAAESAAMQAVGGEYQWNLQAADHRRVLIDRVATAAGDAGRKPLGQMGVAEVVKLIDHARIAGDEERAVVLDMWQLTKFEPQQINGWRLTAGATPPPPLDEEWSEQAVGAAVAILERRAE